MLFSLDLAAQFNTDDFFDNLGYYPVVAVG